jgi:hypothetical protein
MLCLLYILSNVSYFLGVNVAIVPDGTDRVVPETDGVKLMKGFTIQLGRKRTDMEQMSMREHPISDVTG